MRQHTPSTQPHIGLPIVIRYLPRRVAFNHPVFRIELVETIWRFHLPFLPFTLWKPIKTSIISSCRNASFPSLFVQRTPPTPAAAMSEKRRSGSIDRGSGSDINEKAFRQNIVSTTTSPPPPFSYTPRRTLWPRIRRCLGPIFWRPPPMPRR